MLKKWRGVILDICFYLAGCLLYSVAVTALITPNAISPGGITGVAAALEYLFGLPTGITLWVLNIPIIITGFVKLGGIFIIKTAVVTTMMSITLGLTEWLVPASRTDSILAAVFGGLLMGAGLSLVLFRGATTGGVDIIAKLVNRRFPHITVGKIILAADAVVIAFAALAYKNIESALYSVIAVYATSFVMDTVLYGSDKGKMIYIVTDFPDEICRKINGSLGRGVTRLAAVGAYTGKPREMLLCIVRRHEVSAVNAVVKEIDKAAFTVISDAGEIIGEGFKAK